jgi:hypothetical protein
MLGMFLVSAGGTELGINMVLRTSLRPRTLGMRPEVCACCCVSTIVYLEIIRAKRTIRNWLAMSFIARCASVLSSAIG